MTILHKAVIQKSVTAGACVLALTTALAFGVAPAQAATARKMMHQRMHAAKLDRQAAHAAMMGHPKKAAKMRMKAAKLRMKAANGH